MISLALYLTAGILLVLVPVVACAKYLEWRAWDADRRIARLRSRRLRAATESLTYHTARSAQNFTAMGVSADEATKAFRKFGQAFARVKR